MRGMRLRFFEKKLSKKLILKRIGYITILRIEPFNF